MIFDKLQFLAMANNYHVEATQNWYSVYLKGKNDEGHGLMARIAGDGSITYYIDGCYDNGSDQIEIDAEALLNLKKFCEMLTDAKVEK